MHTLCVIEVVAKSVASLPFQISAPDINPISITIRAPAQWVLLRANESLLYDGSPIPTDWRRFSLFRFLSPISHVDYTLHIASIDDSVPLQFALPHQEDGFLFLRIPTARAFVRSGKASRVALPKESGSKVIRLSRNTVNPETVRWILGAVSILLLVGVTALKVLLLRQLADM